MCAATQSNPPWSTLVKAMEGAKEDKYFLPEKFFPSWFRENGTPYFFLFKKNLSVTNIQHSELLSLVRQHVFFKDSGLHAKDVSFHTTAAFTRTIEDIARPVVESVHSTTNDLWKICSLYWPIIEQSIVIDSFFTSCALFLPPTLGLDIVRVCAESGYIHSCGYSLFVRKIYKATQVHFYDSIDRHLMKYPEYYGTLQFIPFSNEDFGDDKDIGHVKDSLQDGLDGVKIKIEKQHMGRQSLVNILHDMEETYRGRLLFRGAGPYKQIHPAASDSTLWLISDHSINTSNARAAGSDKYYICYHQLYFNENPFHFFDENKPAWVAHTTIPHTLLGAMLNITKPWSSDRPTTIGDPFGGTGTTWLEALKHKKIRCLVGDINPMLPVLVHDNVEFFSLPKNELSSHAEELQKIVMRLHTKGDSSDINTNQQNLLLPDDNSRFHPTYQKAVQLIDRLRQGKTPPILSFDFTPETAREVATFSLFERLVFYIALRAELRFQAAYARGAKQRTTAFAESASYLIEEIRSLDDWSTRSADGDFATTPFSVFAGHYSKSCSISQERLSDATNKSEAYGSFTIQDARKIEPNSCDIVITDPPYGFNTEEELFDLAKLYTEVIVALVAAIRHEGHLVVCLPSEALNGRSLPVCTKSQLVTAQILRAAESLGREVYTPARSRPPFITPPYFWNSSALRRTILHFRIRDDNNK